MSSDELHEWASFDVDGSTYLFDLTFLTSNWSCIFGNGCLGVLTAPAADLVQGCCSYGAHFTGKKDRKKVERYAARLTDEQWQFKAEAEARGGAIHKNEDGDIMSELVDGACIFLNRPGFGAGPGCSLHQAALDAGERPLDWKPEVCWQLPLRLDNHVDDNGYYTYTLREWKRRDWGEGGEEFHWWCTETGEAFVDSGRVYQTLRDEIIELVGQEPYDLLCAHLEAQGTEHLLPHPAVRRRAVPISVELAGEV
jgi:hypothetical protein